MANHYILVYNDYVGSREQVKQAIDQDPRIINWRYDLPNMFYLKTALSANDLASIIHKLRGQEGMFIIAQIDKTNKQGWLPEETWNFLNT